MNQTRAYMSFGGGRQSTALAFLAMERHPLLMEVCGGVLPELYIFADTGEEPEDLYAHVDKMAALIRSHGWHFETARTPLGDLGRHVIHALDNGHKRCEQLPFFVHDGVQEEAVAVRRHRTDAFKLKPIHAFARHWFGVSRGKTHDGSNVKMWLGISKDEKYREKYGRVYKQEWAEYFNPLIQMRWHAADCINYQADKVYADGSPVQVSRSACVFCPFHSINEWRRIKENPKDWAKVLAVDEALERAHANGGAFGFTNPLYLNAQAKRMRDLDLDKPPPKFQNSVGWDNECAGVCGV